MLPVLSKALNYHFSNERAFDPILTEARFHKVVLAA